MSGSAWGVDLLVSLAGSMIFWVTVAGMAVRGLHIDFKQLESFLGNFYHRADKFTFRILPVSRLVAEKILASIYGPTHWRIFIVTLATCVAVNGFAITKMISDWYGNGDTIANDIEIAIRHVDPEYHSLVYSTAGLVTIKKAFAQSGSLGAIYFINNDNESEKVRAIYERFWEKYQDYIFEEGLYYEDLLELIFGGAHSNVHWIGLQWAQAGCLILINTAFGILFDMAAVLATISAFASITSRLWCRASLCIIILCICFFLSFLNYSGFLRGNMLGGLLVILPIFYVLCLVPAIYVWSMIVLELGRVWGSMIMTVVVGMALLERKAIMEALPSVWHTAIRPWVEAYIMLRDGGGDIVVIVLSMPALYPAIALASVLMWIAVCKVIFAIFKQVLLGQIYGASIMSGGTFFIGFLTTIISSSAVLLSVWTMFRFTLSGGQ
jgi:hypothetical protein